MEKRNNFLYRIRRKCRYLLNKRYLDEQQKDLLKQICCDRCEKRIYYFCVPSHSNLGDQAQMFCWLRLFTEWFRDYKVVPIKCDCLTDGLLGKIREHIRKGDKIFIHSGYLIFDPHPHLPFIRKIVDMFHDFPIVILPQTINLKEDAVIALTTKSFNSHPMLTIVSRDNVSKSNADKFFPECKRLLMPDVVTSLIGDQSFCYSEVVRVGVLFCIRNDGEKLYTDLQISSLRKRLVGIKTDVCDTSIKKRMSVWDTCREELIRKMIKKFSHYKVIVTDRYHGTIFSQVANTPVVVLASNDHKLSSGVNWFPKEYFGQRVFFANNLNEAYDKITRLLECNTDFSLSPPYFKNNFYASPLDE